MRLDKPSWDTPISECELSTRTVGVCARNSVHTVGDAKEKLDHLTKHAKGFGSKCKRELQEVIRWVEEAQQPDLLQTPEYIAYKLEDSLTTITALLSDVNRWLLHAALKGRLTAETRNHLRLKLLDAAEKTMQLPTYTGD